MCLLFKLVMTQQDCTRHDQGALLVCECGAQYCPAKQLTQRNDEVRLMKATLVNKIVTQIVNAVRE